MSSLKLHTPEDHAALQQSLYGSTPADLAANVNAACAEIGREVALRRRVYPRWVQQGRLRPDQASQQIGDLELAAKLLRELSGVRR